MSSHLFKLCKFIVGQYKQTNIKKLLSHQKNTVGIINNRRHFDHTNKLFKSQKFRARSLVVSDLRSKPKILGFSPAATYVQS